MNEGPEAPIAAPQFKERRHGFRWLIVLGVLVASLGSYLWMNAPYLDPRLAGEWRREDGSTLRFHADGRFEKGFRSAWRVSRWSSGAPEWSRRWNRIVIEPPSSLATRMISSVLFGKTTVFAMHYRYQILEVTETTLRLRPIPEESTKDLPEEQFTRVPIPLK